LILSVENLSYSHSPGQKALVSGLSFHVKENELCLISGPNGLGKSTLLKVLMGQIPALSGKINWERSCSKAYLPQLENMEFHLPITLGDALELVKKGEKVSEDYDKILPSSLWSRPWNTSSGGERKRTLITRLLIQKPHILILDEPMNHLDPESRKLVMDAFRDFLKNGHSAIILVSHGGLTSQEKEGIVFKEIALLAH
jgi:ABC-type Mn2+/Zn2+ transport system ATPase subunit